MHGSAYGAVQDARVDKELTKHTGRVGTGSR